PGRTAAIAGDPVGRRAHGPGASGGRRVGRLQFGRGGAGQSLIPGPPPARPPCLTASARTVNARTLAAIPRYLTVSPRALTVSNPSPRLAIRFVMICDRDATPDLRDHGILAVWTAGIP